MDEVFVLSGVRTAVGAFGGALKDTPPTELAAQVSTEAIRRSGVEAAAIGHAVFGQVIQTEPRDAYLARWAALESGCAVETPALGVNRLCGSGLQAVVSAAQVLRLGEADTALAGGAESMSRAPYLVPAARFGAKMGDAALVDGLTGALTDPFNRYHMGMTAENVAERYGIDRAVQDDIAHESHRRASAADREGRFVDQIQPIQVKQKGKPIIFDRDEHIRHDASRADFERLKPVFKTGGSVTAGNASGINDGAAALVLAGEATVKRLALKPMARIVSWGHAGVDPAVMGLGPIAAVRQALTRAGLRIADMDLIESNEAFAAQACAVSRELGLDSDKVNPNGSGISIGHPVGATGAINSVKAVYELQRTGGRYAMVTLCIGGGQGIAAIFERC
ncbi:MAG: beta-ketothiolase BktB [Alphaproteobacteria bacterium]|uniref:beta-ketothiolase BktB n=1 Tax=Brevundimonas sp. TaxID=1871086 RepID=UPI000DAFE4D2|nr:beta-ketothiolase BktB [Alphaproteobacteria bacterium]MBU1520307.1 beta-ketothiolase BktB [Alphaproteobacteria bacterium]MBU2030824.1 beta-ketothiolase BktB [Alphaproteobacteria bacterium]MBU2163516.1 beta-ketothiolase BktB [Alphaproteobacteria bacterium]MBU2231621.1 beta-ketothiolase BktB [Alphaproteobacteria bacterium]